MSDFETVAQVGDIPLGEGRSFPVNGRMVGVFHLAEGYKAINDTCPHMGASLSTGYVENDAVTCPWHAWRFCVSDGVWLDNPRVKTDCYEVRIQGDNIQVLVPDPEPRAGSTHSCD
jgi:nitrite reductase (NADH) small subunit/3-phenylpropionate/trans-cinnamate dioxygenase ferredoxin subunit